MAYADFETITRERPKTLSKEKLEMPSMWTVAILNDNFTPMDFVIDILMRIFHLPYDEAEVTMLEIHTEGKALVGHFIKEIADDKANTVIKEATEKGHPLKAYPSEV